MITGKLSILRSLLDLVGHASGVSPDTTITLTQQAVDDLQRAQAVMRTMPSGFEETSIGFVRAEGRHE